VLSPPQQTSPDVALSFGRRWFKRNCISLSALPHRPRRVPKESGLSLSIWRGGARAFIQPCDGTASTNPGWPERPQSSFISGYRISAAGADAKRECTAIF
jgi:hypothetical protein